MRLNSPSPDPQVAFCYDDPMKYQVALTESAKADISYFRPGDQRLIVAGIVTHLSEEAAVDSRNNKPLRPNAVAPRELRLDTFRIFYEIVDNNQVKIIAVGRKEHNKLLIRGQEVPL